MKFITDPHKVAKAPSKTRSLPKSYMPVGCTDPEGELLQLHGGNERAQQTGPPLSVEAWLGTLLGKGQGHSTSVQIPEPKTKTAIILQVIIA